MTRTDWYPEARKRPITSKIRSRDGWDPNAVVNHIAAGESTTLFDFFSSPKRGCSTFYVLKDGGIEQYLPISSRSMADVQGNRRTVSLEYQGGSYATRSQPYTDAQIEASIRLHAWLHREWGIPLALMANSRTKTAGVGYHRLGIDGNFPHDDLFGGRQQRGGGELWSTSSGKTCPDNFVRPADAQSRIFQVANEIIPGAVELVGGIIVPPAPLPPEKPVVDDGIIDVDGFWGRDTTTRLQDEMGTPVDGEVWRQSPGQEENQPGCTHGWKWDGKRGDGGSPLIHALHAHLRKKGIPASVLGTDDGKMGPKHARGIQRYVGTTQDGELWAPSPAIARMQEMLNDGTF